jgi:hypothetical protein
MDRRTFTFKVSMMKQWKLYLEQWIWVLIVKQDTNLHRGTFVIWEAWVGLRPTFLSTRTGQVETRILDRWARTRRIRFQALRNHQLRMNLLKHGHSSRSSRQRLPLSVETSWFQMMKVAVLWTGGRVVNCIPCRTTKLTVKALRRSLVIKVGTDLKNGWWRALPPRKKLASNSRCCQAHRLAASDGRRVCSQLVSAERHVWSSRTEN